MRSDPVAPVITGNITTRKRSTSPARSSDRHRLRLPIVLRRPEPSSFIARTASTASARTKVPIAADDEQSAAFSGRLENPVVGGIIGDVNRNVGENGWPHPVAALVLRALGAAPAGHQPRAVLLAGLDVGQRLLQLRR